MNPVNGEGLIPIAGGVIMFIFAGRTGKFGKAVKVLAPVVILFGILQLIGIIK